MSIVETVLVFAGIPLGVFVLAAIVVLGPGAMRTPRYRPGGPWEFEPVWYLPHPEHAGPVSALHSAGENSGRLALPSAVAEPVKGTGGASGEW